MNMNEPVTQGIQNNHFLQKNKNDEIFFLLFSDDFWVKEPRHSEIFFRQKKVYLYRSTQVPERRCQRFFDIYAG